MPSWKEPGLDGMNQALVGGARPGARPGWEKPGPGGKSQRLNPPNYGQESYTFLHSQLPATVGGGGIEVELHMIENIKSCQPMM